LGQLVAQTEALPLAQRLAAYQTIFLEGLKIKTTPSKHAEVLLHLLGYFKKDLSADEKQEMLEWINNFKLELVPLIVPLTLMQHYVRKYDQPYLKKQIYLNPHPLELKLRNHV
jgi:uncharacterized protein YbgA (DUF1722 family)